MNQLFTMLGIIIGIIIAGVIIDFEEGTKRSYKARGIPLFGPIQVTTTSERNIGCIKSILFYLLCAAIGGILGFLLDKIKLQYSLFDIFLIYEEWRIPEYLKCMIVIVIIIVIIFIIRKIIPKSTSK